MKDSLSGVLSKFLEAIAKERGMDYTTPFLDSLVGIYNNITKGAPLPSCVYRFLLSDESTGSIITKLKDIVQEQNSSAIGKLNSPLVYLLDELICNIQQHAQTDYGFAFIGNNTEEDCVEIVIADAGITIYGSYVSAQKYLELVGNSDAEALDLAQKGYSTKNLPDAENRGYGISSNIRMVVEGLHGEFAVLSGNALLLHLKNKNKILALPRNIDFKGTMIIVRFPAIIPDDFNLYHFIN